MIAINAKNSADVIVNEAAHASNGDSVVLNDTKAISLKSNASAYREITALVADRNNWEVTAYRTSNDQLYALLQRCYSLYTDMCVERTTAKQLVKDVDKYLKDELGVKPLDSTHTMTKIVRCVFGAERRRVSAYSIALRAALAAKIPAADIPEFIRSSGGVEELRLAQSPNAKTQKQKAEAAAHVTGRVIEALRRHPDLRSVALV